MTSEDNKYMTRKKFYVPKTEVERDYRRGNPKVGDFLYLHEWGVIEEDEDAD